jgi:lysylphosphatidylglycerol synthetase-like protein (DUF2156 family)
MNKLAKRLFEKIGTVTKAFAVVLKAFWNDERSGPYIWASVCTIIILIGSTLTSAVWASYSTILICGVALGIFLLILTAHKNFPNDDQIYRGAPLRTGQKIIKAVAIPFIVLVAIVWLGPYYMKSTKHFVSFVSSLQDWHTIITIIAIIVILIGISIWNYASYSPDSFQRVKVLGKEAKKILIAHIRHWIYFYYGVLASGIIALFYYFLPHILPYIESLISYVMTFIG